MRCWSRLKEQNPGHKRMNWAECEEWLHSALEIHGASPHWKESDEISFEIRQWSLFRNTFLKLKQTKNLQLEKILTFQIQVFSVSNFWTYGRGLEPLRKLIILTLVSALMFSHNSDFFCLFHCIFIFNWTCAHKNIHMCLWLLVL